MEKIKKVILIDGEDKTGRIESIQLVRHKGKSYFKIYFRNNIRPYLYGTQRVEVLSFCKELNPIEIGVYRKQDGKILNNIESIIEFRGKYSTAYNISYKNGASELCLEEDIRIRQNKLACVSSQHIFNYLKELSKLNPLRSQNTDELLLLKRYENLGYVDSSTALASYIKPKQKSTLPLFKELIFPFGCNNSQYKAIKNALTNQFSVIQGPPGTGKTQTILNIVANILFQGKSVLIVSNNNAVVENILEKLAKYQLDFPVAYLGSKENKDSFFLNQSGEYPDLSSWILKDDYMGTIQKELKEKVSSLPRIFEIQEKIAILRQELSELETEFHHFKEFFKNTNISPMELNLHSSKKLFKLWNECEEFYKSNKKIKLIFKIKNFLFYGIRNWEFYKLELPNLTTQFQNMFYQYKQKEIKETIKCLLEEMAFLNGNEILDNLTSDSLKILKGYLANKYGKGGRRVQFSEEDLQRQSERVLSEYPVILSTTFSSTTSLGRDVIYDYLIIDEASQVDIATGALALSCAQNAVIVGDSKQLPHIVTKDVKQKSLQLFNEYRVSYGYKYTNSFLQSVLDVIPDIPEVLLREHYRCHPKIINFCNQKFYNGDLIIMTIDNGEKNVLQAIRTPKGNHAREHYSQREIDIILKDIIPNYDTDREQTGVITPYRKQKTKLQEQINYLESDTVHKFQGREKDTIIITTVDNNITRFTDDPYLLNVAISRAKSKLFIVMTGNEQSLDKNISDLLGYIQYNNFEVRESPIYSIFDYLYKQYEKERKEYLSKRKRLSRYDSENLMYHLIKEIFTSDEKYNNLDIIHSYKLRNLVKNFDLLTESEAIYASHGNTHLDFLITNRLTKEPVLAVEVDGYAFHKVNSTQFKRDSMKDTILGKCGIPLVRFKTNESQEKQRLIKVLDEVLRRE
ncbi:AAA domain-containing protein [Streptococcus ruminantium]|uniref:AAA domain-containing protein n=1 Tax=Streptococcus ruminantium TaxID=1917441 RepID=UPI0012DDE5FC|nr:AAA domain-containing protein [Streptococcus ruminantium]